jgi:thymidylate synthase
MIQHQELMEAILTRGRKKLDRTGVGTISLFGPQIEFNLADGFPIPTERQVGIKGIIEELRWFLSGQTNNEILREAGVQFWTRWALKEDKFVEHTLTNAERAGEFAKQIGKTPAQAALELQSFQSEEAGHLFLDAQGVPRVVSKQIAAKGDLGPVYGAMWRNWPTHDGTTIDQISTLVNNLKSLPWSRRHVISGWNPALLPDEKLSHEENILAGKQCLPPCHTLFQFILEPLTLDEQIAMYRGGHDAIVAAVDSLTAGLDAVNKEPYIEEMLRGSAIPDKMLSCKLHARSQDVPVGTVFNIASYAAFVHMLSHLLGFKPGSYIHSMGDAHIYTNQVEMVKLQLSRSTPALPTLSFNRKPMDLFDFKFEDFKLAGYNPHPKIDYPIAV